MAVLKIQERKQRTKFSKKSGLGWATTGPGKHTEP